MPEGVDNALAYHYLHINPADLSIGRLLAYLIKPTRAKRYIVVVNTFFLRIISHHSCLVDKVQLTRAQLQGISVHLKHNLEPSLNEIIDEAFAQIEHETQSNLMREFQEVVFDFRRSQEQVSELALAVERINGQMRKWREEDPKPKKSSRLTVMMTAAEEALIKSIRGDK